MRKRRMIIGIALAAAAAALALWAVLGYLPTRHIETPAYRVAERRQGYELRDYEGYIVAEIRLTGAYRDTLYAGFRGLADYIFGNNTRRDALPMTAPVLQQESSQPLPMTAPVLQQESGAAGEYVVAFVMPRSHTLDTLPQPVNPNVTLRAVPPARYAALRFSGYATEGRAAAKTALLRERIARDRLEALAAPTIAQYNPPWTPPFMRRNEVLIEVAAP